ncbi:condensation domain-containing protein [Streptomyces sp. NPDC059605]|uniref:condensation domain-containing protein n=1 Tax=unclassified Streptomyces TaxID=2593676 RepID=UPI0036BCB39A
MTVVVDPGEPPYDAPPFLELRGPLDTRRLEAALDRLAARRPDGPAWQHRLRPHGPGLHTLRLTMGAPGEFPAGLLADLLTDPPLTGRCVRTAEASPLQLELLADADAHPGTGRHVEQLAWNWHGPLDPERFTAAWQSLFDRESVLRSAFDDGPEPRIVVHDRVRAEVVRLPHSTEDWASVVEYERRRGVDPRRPGPLRVTVLGGGPVVSVTAPPTRVLLTYHHALLDDWSARLLLREFYRAYLADGVLPGGERRPDMGDYTQWLARRDVGPAREFWTDAAPPPDAAHSPLPNTSDTPVAPDTSASASALHGTGAGTGRTRLRLTAGRTARLGAWAAGWGSTESGALQAVWALLLYRATGSADPRPVRFSVTVSGRGIPFDSAERLPGSLRNPLPMSVVVDPRSSVPALLALLRDRALDMAAYEWVTAGRIRGWTENPDRPAGPEGSLVAFDGRPRNTDGLAPELAARGIRVDPPETLGARTAFPLTLAAHHDEAGGLVMTVTYDRAQLAGIGGVLAHAVYLLDELPRIAGEFTTVAEVLELLPAVDLDASTGAGTGTGAEVLPATDDGTEAEAEAEAGDGAEAGTGIEAGTGTGAGGASTIITLRPSRKLGAGTICLVPTHSTPRFRHDLLARSYRGPEALVLLGTPPDDVRAGYDALRPLIDAGGPLVLGGFTGCGVAAYGITRLIAENGGRPPLIVLTGTATSAADLARLLESAAERAG